MAFGIAISPFVALADSSFVSEHAFSIITRAVRANIIMILRRSFLFFMQSSLM
ncbi:hypothetical protein JCM10914_1787 [Paenibacillus sp. JCM 10914]|nr:hypothetical protein JCM10914_1787 [Paenibacillus sp. JCM 10914]